MISQVFNMDCMEYLKDIPDGWFNLAVVDPEYGLNVITKRAMGNPLRKDGTIRNGIDKRNGTTIYRKPSKYKLKSWDSKPVSKTVLTEIFRVSKNQIIWGANHFISLMPYDSSCWIVWDKINGSNDNADFEMAWTSFKGAARLFPFMWNGMLQGSMIDGRKLEGNVSKREIRIHPTQKPVALYDKIFSKYLPQGGKVLDTHLGSGSSRIAADKAGNIDFYGTEIDSDYFNDHIKRWNIYKSQLKLELY